VFHFDALRATDRNGRPASGPPPTRSGRRDRGRIGRVLAVAGCAALARSAPGQTERSRPATPYVWQHAQVVGGGFVSGIVTHPNARGLMYCRTDIGGAYRWDPARRRWASISEWIDADHWNYTGTESLAIDPSDPAKVFIAAGTYTNDWAGNGAILRSGDRGETWAVSPLPFKLGGNEDGRNNGERSTWRRAGTGSGRARTVATPGPPSPISPPRPTRRGRASPT
jgi:hypothetical protein